MMSSCDSFYHVTKHEVGGELLAYLEGATQEARHHLGSLQEVLVHHLRVGLLQSEEGGPGSLVVVLEVETSDDGDDVVERVRVLSRDLQPRPGDQLALRSVTGGLAALEAAQRPPALGAAHVGNWPAIALHVGLSILGQDGRGEVERPVAADTARLGLPAGSRH